jgi:peroxiredoxin
MQHSAKITAPAWAKNALYAAAIYNLIWGAIVIVAPLAIFRWAAMEEPRYPQIWQCVGMIVGVYGVGYWIAARDPFRHWPIILVGFLGKILGPIGFLDAALKGTLPWAWGATIITNDLIWWVPFASLLYLAFRHNTGTSIDAKTIELSDALRTIRSHRNASLQKLSEAAPTVVVFLRHAGCTFCRESVSHLQSACKEARNQSLNFAVVHMGTPIEGTLLLHNRELTNVHRFSDPQCLLYRAFGLERGTVGQLFSPNVIRNGIRAILKGHGLGKLSGDGFRMPGAFAIVDGEVVAEHRSKSADDHPDLRRMINTATLVWASKKLSRQSGFQAKPLRDVAAVVSNATS